MKCKCANTGDVPQLEIKPHGLYFCIVCERWYNNQKEINFPKQPELIKEHIYNVLGLNEFKDKQVLKQMKELLNIPSFKTSCEFAHQYDVYTDWNEFIEATQKLIELVRSIPQTLNIGTVKGSITIN